MLRLAQSSEHYTCSSFKTWWCAWLRGLAWCVTEMCGLMWVQWMSEWMFHNARSDCARLPVVLSKCMLCLLDLVLQHIYFTSGDWWPAWPRCRKLRHHNYFAASSNVSPGNFRSNYHLKHVSDAPCVSNTLCFTLAAVIVCGCAIGTIAHYFCRLRFESYKAEWSKPYQIIQRSCTAGLGRSRWHLKGLQRYSPCVLVLWTV